MTKRQLLQYKSLKEEVKLLERQMEDVYAEMSSLQSPKLNGMPHGSEPGTLDNVIIKYDSILDMLDKCRIEKAKELERIESAIESVEDARARMLLRYRYIFGYRWATIADLMHYELRNIYNIHGEALEAIREK